jgi:hypothetical protein
MLSLTGGDRGFESGFLQRRVRCELGFSDEARTRRPQLLPLRSSTACSIRGDSYGLRENPADTTAPGTWLSGATLILVASRMMMSASLPGVSEPVLSSSRSALAPLIPETEGRACPKAAGQSFQA